MAEASIFGVGYVEELVEWRLTGGRGGRAAPSDTASQVLAYLAASPEGRRSAEVTARFGEKAGRNLDRLLAARSRRALPLPPDVAAALARLKLTQKAESLAVGVARGPAIGWSLCVRMGSLTGRSGTATNSSGRQRRPVCP